MKINDEGTSNAAYWHKRAMKAEAGLADRTEERDDSNRNLTAALKRETALAARLADEESVCRIQSANFASALLRADAAEARLAEAVAAVQAFADHFGPLEDNHMLSDECRHCFALAHAVLGATVSASGGPR